MLTVQETAELREELSKQQKELIERFHSLGDEAMDDVDFLDSVNNYNEWLSGAIRVVNHILSPNHSKILLEDLDEMFSDYGF